MHHTKPSNAG